MIYGVQWIRPVNRSDSDQIRVDPNRNPTRKYLIEPIQITHWIMINCDQIHLEMFGHPNQLPIRSEKS